MPPPRPGAEREVKGGSMKKVEAIIRPEMLPVVRRALEDLGWEA